MLDPFGPQAAPDDCTVAVRARCSGVGRGSASLDHEVDYHVLDQEWEEQSATAVFTLLPGCKGAN